MKKLLILTIPILITCCSLLPELRELTIKKTTSSLTVSNDYTTNLIDEWVANRGYAINLLVVKQWNGFKNGTKLIPYNYPVAPDNYIQPSDQNDCYLWNSTNTNFSGAFTAAFIVSKPTPGTKATPLFDTFANAPNCKLLLRISATNAHIGISYNGIIYDCGTTFPYDNNFHQLVYKIDGANNIAQVWLDNVKQGNDFTITGGAINSGSGMYFFKDTSGNFYGVGSYKKIRLYNEYIADSTVNKLYTGDFKDNVVDNTPTILFCIGGQSNVQPPTPDNVIAQYPDSLKNGFPNVQLFNWISNINVFNAIPANTQTFYFGSYPVAIGANLSAACELQKKFPSRYLYMCQMSKGSAGMSDTWTPHIANDLYNTRLKPVCKEAYQLLSRVEQRPVTVYLLWIQGEADANTVDPANAYYQGLTDMAADFRTNVDPNTIFIISALSTRTNKPYGNVIRQAQFDFVASDTIKNKYLDTEDAARFPFYSSPPLHYTQLGCINIGKDAVKFIN